jgi:hypothetical protein
VANLSSIIQVFEVFLIMKKVYFGLAMLTLLAGCGNSGDAGEKTAAPADAATSSEPASAPLTTPVAGGAILECDAYLDKVMACIREKIPAEQRGAMEQAVQQSRESWATISDQAALAQACTSALDQAKASYAAIGCEF